MKLDENAKAKIFSKSHKALGLARNLLAGTAGKLRSLASGVRSSRLGSPAMACATCLVAGTAVQTVDGAVLIENIRPGDQVLAYDAEAEAWTYDRVTARHERMRKTQVVTITVEMSDGSIDSLTATSDHPFWVESGEGLATRPLATAHSGQRDGRYVSPTGGRWVEAGHLTLGDQLLTKYNESATITGLRIRTERQRVYNLTVLRLHNYAAGNASVLVHNSGACLGNALIRAGKPFPGKGYEAHHIVAENAELAEPARKVLQKFNIGLDTAVNGKWLPGTNKMGLIGMIVHRGKYKGMAGVHSKAYYKAVNKRLEKARTREDAIRALNKIEDLLGKGIKFW